MLGNGMYNVVGGRYAKFIGSFGPPKLILQLHIDYADGTSSAIVSDDSWKAAAGPIAFSCIYGGEDYDARKEIAGWDMPGFDDSAWEAATSRRRSRRQARRRVGPADQGDGRVQADQGDAAKPGVFVYDLGQNLAGLSATFGARSRRRNRQDDPRRIARSHRSGPPNAVRHARMVLLHAQGQRTRSLASAVLILRLRYVQVEGGVPEGTPNAPADLPRILDLKGQFVHCSAETVGQFHLLESEDQSGSRHHRRGHPEQLAERVDRLPTSREVRLAGGVAPAGRRHHVQLRLPAFYAKICDDMREAQTADGLVPDIAPEYTVFPGGFRDSPEWGSAYVIDPWHVYQMYGDASCWPSTMRA